MSIMDRMKLYEKAARTKLPPRMPVIIRVDGKAFHTYTKRCHKPFDPKLMEAMDMCAMELCYQIHGAQLAYIQSDEISILIHNYKTYNTQPWFDNQVQKMVSVSAAIAASTMTLVSHTVFGYTKPATFDARAFVLPERDVCNYFLARQQDWTRNSVQMLARSFYSHKECHKKNNAELQEMCFTKGANWNNLSTSLKRGRCVVRRQNQTDPEKWVWKIDEEIPIFSQDRDYIESHLSLEEE